MFKKKETKEERFVRNQIRTMLFYYFVPLFNKLTINKISEKAQHRLYSSIKVRKGPALMVEGMTSIGTQVHIRYLYQQGEFKIIAAPYGLSVIEYPLLSKLKENFGSVEIEEIAGSKLITIKN